MKLRRGLVFNSGLCTDIYIKLHSVTTEHIVWSSVKEYALDAAVHYMLIVV